ncbi:non-hydrolyzing UDP-N-acetylglucosamine 2-epimerase [Thiothrix eikelboomii]|uniref:non-hydrolyzing UDP-N-acetylglucosamine 2-epimerase n=1 Tax=Thiothrix eikelboomii TaxID=92487 RepID=UPI003BB026D1
MKILTVIGARPQFIKAAAVSHTFAQQDGIQEVLLHTGQHFDKNMSEVFFKELGIPKPTYNLGIGGGLHGAMTGAQLVGIEEILLQEKPDWVLVYGDTNSTLAGALAAAKLHIPVAHIEAGLRSFNRRMPEEINRVVTDHISALLFAPSATAMQHLMHEGIPTEYCHQVGDVMYDAALLFGERAKQQSTILQQLNLTAGEYILTTIHRAENTDNLQRLQNILKSLSEASQTLPIIWPVHPRTRNLLQQQGLYTLLGKNVHIIEPVGYLDMVMLEQHAAVIATDSGGIQKEAFFYHIPCITLRDETEWVELVDAGWNHIVPPTNTDNITHTLLAAIQSYGTPIHPYGDGHSSSQIAKILLAQA